jgi:hypothetical protein
MAKERDCRDERGKDQDHGPPQYGFLASGIIVAQPHIHFLIEILEWYQNRMSEVHLSKGDCIYCSTFTRVAKTEHRDCTFLHNHA